ncbi:group II intron reverse transcriptase domain-containing protein [Candidatus Nomurabacteria bacterium]|nr:group II intron reverse transcriptase domain-containing protein [Candidatus Nomurabacteria bacterium]
MDNIISLHNDIKDKTYRHSGYQSFNISDPKPRNIHKATVRDRVVHHLIYKELYPYFDSEFIHDSYSCRINKGTHRAINRFRDFHHKVSYNNTRTCYVLKCDIKKFFASIDHTILKKILERHIKDKDIFWLLEQVIDSFSSSTVSSMSTLSAIAESVIKIKKGLPLGNLTSQLLVNIYMNEFDQYVKRELKVKYYIRYADDFVILQNDKMYLESILLKIKEFLEKGLKLDLHSDKVFIKTIGSGVDFLGWVHFSKHRVLRTSTKRRMMKRLRENPNTESVQSYLGMLKHGDGYKLRNKILK